MKRCALIWALLATLALPADERAKPARIDFDCQPQARVWVDGVDCGLTPFSSCDLRPGGHHVRMVASGYEPYDGTLRVVAGGYQVEEHELAAMKGLFLLQTEPEGCQLELDGVTVGETPRLFTWLDVGRAYRFVLTKPGYQSKRIEVRLEGRVPVVRKETLLLDSGTIDFASEPAGADVYVNGVRRGVTPLVLERIPRGHTEVRLVLGGYEEFSKTFSVHAGLVEKLDVALVAKPGSLELSAVQPGVEFKVDGELRGKGRVTLSPLAARQYRVTATLAGYTEETRLVTLAPGAKAEERFDLRSEMGSLVVRTIPAGAQVLVNGRSYGRTRAVEGAGEGAPSEKLIIDGLIEGEYEVTVRADGYGEKQRRRRVLRNQATDCDLKLTRVFEPNVEITTSAGTKVRGVYLDKNAVGIMVETAPGVTRTFQPDQIAKIDFLTGN